MLIFWGNGDFGSQVVLDHRDMPSKFSKNDIKPHNFDKIDIKYKISVSELTSPPNFSLILLKLKPVVVTSSILLWFWRQFVTCLHTTKLRSNF